MRTLALIEPSILLKLYLLLIGIEIPVLGTGWGAAEIRKGKAARINTAVKCILTSEKNGYISTVESNLRLKECEGARNEDTCRTFEHIYSIPDRRARE